MSERTLKAALGVLAGLVLIYAVVLLTRSDGRVSSEGAALARALARAAEGELAGVSIAGASGDVELASGADGWTVNGLPAEPNTVDRLTSALEAVRVGDLIASNPSNHGRLGVSEDSATAVTFTLVEGDPVRVLVGKAGPSFTSGYMRLPDEYGVYLVDGGLRGAVGRAPDDWRERTIAEVDTSAVERIALSRDGASRELVRDGESWTVASAPADSSVVVNLLRELASLEATGFATDTTTFAGDSERAVVALGAAGDTLVALDLRMLETDVLVRRAGDPVTYRLSAFRADRLVPELEGLTGDAESGI